MSDTLQTRDHRHRPEDRMLAIPGNIAAEMVTTSHIDIAAVTIMNHFTYEIWRSRYMYRGPVIQLCYVKDKTVNQLANKTYY